MVKQAFNKAAKPREDRSKSPSPFSLHLNWEQRDKLDELAQGSPWGTYIKEVVFNSGRRVRLKYHELDHKLIAKLLGTLGKSCLASNINQLAKAANSGSLPVNEEVTQALLKACRTIEWMRITLIEALGLKAHQPSKAEQEHKPNDP